MIIPGQFGFNCPSGFREEAFWYMNVHWMVLYKLKVFCSDMKFKMAATAGLSLTLDPMGKMFQNASSLKPLGLIIFVVSEKKAFEHFPIGSYVNLCPAVAAILNFRGMIIGRSSTKFLFFYADRKFKMAATAGHRLT
jgi:hypothetical protein